MSISPSESNMRTTLTLHDFLYSSGKYGTRLRVPVFGLGERRLSGVRGFLRREGLLADTAGLFLLHLLLLEFLESLHFLIVSESFGSLSESLWLLAAFEEFVILACDVDVVLLAVWHLLELEVPFGHYQFV